MRLCVRPPSGIEHGLTSARSAGGKRAVKHSCVLDRDDRFSGKAIRAIHRPRGFVRRSSSGRNAPGPIPGRAARSRGTDRLGHGEQALAGSRERLVVAGGEPAGRSCDLPAPSAVISTMSGPAARSDTMTGRAIARPSRIESLQSFRLHRGENHCGSGAKAAGNVDHHPGHADDVGRLRSPVRGPKVRRYTGSDHDPRRRIRTGSS